MKKIKEYKIIIIIVLVLILGTFYWFQIRPTQIRKECMILAQKGINAIEEYRASKGILDSGIISERYMNCIKLKGLNN